jgi:hypothetical protein
MNELFHAHPGLYILGLMLLAGCLFRYVWKHEKATSEQHRLEQRRPFK